MRGLLLLSDPHYAQINAGRWPGEKLSPYMHIQREEAAAGNQPSLLSALQLKLCRLREDCDWICVMAEGNMLAYALILAAQLQVDRLVLLGDTVFRRHPDRLQRRINAFARRNLSLITAEIIAVGMEEQSVAKLSAGLGYHCGGLLAVQDTSELWRRRESFLTAPFSTLAD